MTGIDECKGVTVKIPLNSENVIQKAAV